MSERGIRDDIANNPTGRGRCSPAASMCQSGTYMVSGSSALFYSTLIWTHTGTGTLEQLIFIQRITGFQ
ncbi:MAG: hypothetical protein IPH45_09225 [Bacteroidales bacterium]|nr:hypothetical protein [Bacteroidales bacterium]